MRFIIRPHVIDKRIIETREFADDIIGYDIDNCYPQRLRAYALQSGTCMKCLNRYGDFLTGKGFKDKTFYEAIINNRGQTVDELLRLVIEKDFRFFKAFALFVRWNASYEVTEVKHVPFDWCRFAKIDTAGYYGKIAVYDNWEELANRKSLLQEKKYYDLYNPNPQIIDKQVEAAGGWLNWQGQILLYTPIPNEYPAAVYDAIKTDVITDAEISNYDYRSVTNDFSAKVIYLHPTELSDEEDENGESQLGNKITELESFQGTDGGNVMIIDNAQQGWEYLKTLDIPNSDARYQQTSDKVERRIREHFAIPPILVGQEMSVGLGNSQVIKDAYDLYNELTWNDRNRLEIVFKKIFSRFKGNINPSNDYSIMALNYGSTTNISNSNNI